MIDKNAEIKRVILDIDDSPQAKKHIDNYLKTKGGLFLPKREYCQGCGDDMAPKRKEIYFGETFCKECVDKWKQGQE